MLCQVGEINREQDLDCTCNNFLMAGCSNKAVYDNIQLNNRQECNSVPSAQYQECIERSNKSYEEYEQERKAAARAS